MNSGEVRRILSAIMAFFTIWVGIQYFLPLIAPFLMGWFLAYLAKPFIKFMQEKLRFGRPLASAVAVTAVLAGLLGLLILLGALCYRELTMLASGLPEYGRMLAQRMGTVRDWAVQTVSRAPGSVGQMLSQAVRELFTGSSVLVEKLTSGALTAAGNVAGRLPGGALTLGTGVISGYMIAAQYPSLAAWFQRETPWLRRWRQWLVSLGDTVRQWAAAQLKLSGLTFLLVGGGFLILRVKQPLLWAAVTAVVDAVPILGTGTVLIPMAVVSLLWGEKVRGIGLIALYITAMMTRSSLEPRLVGRELGMNPLVTLMALYAGFRLWGVTGMILSPILAVTVQRMTSR